MNENMKRLLLLFTFCLLYISSVCAIDISRLEPACWWVGMKNPELQIMVYGKNIASSQVHIDYPGVRVKEVVGVENPNYLFLYLDVSKEASPGTMNLIFQKGKEKEVRTFELKEKNKKVGAAGFSPAVNKWENENSCPDITLLAPIARLLNISLELLLVIVKSPFRFCSV